MHMHIASIHSAQENDGLKIVIDNGSDTTKCGFGMDDAPRSVFPSVVGRLRHQSVLHLFGVNTKDVYVGDEAMSKRGILKLIYPMENGNITNWNDMETIWQHIFHNELRVQPEDHAVFLTEAPLNPKPNRAKITEMMFESLNVPSLYLKNKVVCSIFATGKRSGTVVHIGHTVSHVVPIYKGYAVKEAILTSKFGGRYLTDYLLKLLCERGYSMTGGVHLTMIPKDMKEKMCYVALDYTREMKTTETLSETKYELPDGCILSVGNERFRCPEVLFHPQYIGHGSKCKAIHEILFDSINKCDANIRNQVKDDIILSGGSAMFDGLDDRILKELKLLFCGGSDINKIVIDGYMRKHCCELYKDIGTLLCNYLMANCCVVNYKECMKREYLPWIGGSILSSLLSSDEWMNKQQYNDIGPGIVHRMCL